MKIRRTRRPLKARGSDPPTPDSYDWHVFLSHSSADKRRARMIVRGLNERGLSVWFDETQVQPGDSIIDKIETGLAKSRQLVFLLSKTAGHSPWCRAEYRSLLLRQIESSLTRVLVIHFEALIPKDIPPLLANTRRIDLRDPSALDQLVDRVRRPLTIGEYCSRVAQKPLVPSGVLNGDYHVEPGDLLPVVLSEVYFQFGDPVRAVRTGETPVSFADFLSDLRPTRRGRSFVLFGEAGIGKTTLCKYVCRCFAEDRSGKTPIPVYVALGDWNPSALSFRSLLDVEGGLGTFDEMLAAAKASHRGIVMFVDGLNEQDPVRVDQALAVARDLADSHSVAVVLTSRPVGAADRIWPAGDVRFFEISRWTQQQLAQYFQKNKQAALLKLVPMEVRNSLRLPLLAFLVIRRACQDGEPPNLRMVADVFAYVLDQFVRPEHELSKAKNITEVPRSLRVLAGDALRRLGYQMTADRVVQTLGKSLEDSLSSGKRSCFQRLLAHLVNSGLLRCSNSMVAVDPKSGIRELRSLKIGFLHQSLQEYLAAQYILTSSGDELPTDVSHDAFWREVPVYMMRYLARSPSRQFALARQFLVGKLPDYLTCARLLDEIADAGLKASLRRDLIGRLLKNLEDRAFYPYSIDAFKTLGHAGAGALRTCVRDFDALRTVFAEAEAHLLNQVSADGNDPLWQRLGRSLYILGELGEVGFLKDIREHAQSIRSLHLRYHLGEALLTLTRTVNLTSAQRDVIGGLARMLRTGPGADPILRGQALAVSWALSGKAGPWRSAANGLSEFLIAQSVTDRPFFKEEFWRRAHGVETLAEIAPAAVCMPVLNTVFITEEGADYSGYPTVGYHLVHSSVLKAISRACGRSKSGRLEWQPLLEVVFSSRRVSENGWACRHLELLLLKWFTEPDQLPWIREWRDSEKLGGPLIRSALSNVIWLAG